MLPFFGSCCSGVNSCCRDVTGPPPVPPNRRPVNDRTPLDLFDPARDRKVPVSFYEPAPGTPEPWPLVVFSTGFGGGRDGYAGLARAWSRAGLAVAVLEHVGSGGEALERLNRLPRAERPAELERLVRDPDEVRERPRDVSFVLDHLAGNPSLDPHRIGVGGHSFGACTALAIGGLPAALADGRRLELGDPRAGAVLALSPPVPGLFFAPEDHGCLSVPALLVTGTRDHGPFLDSPRQDRTRAFHLLPEGRAWLAVFQGADHMAFAEMGLRHRSLMAPLQALTSAWWRQALAEGPGLDAATVAEHVGGPEVLTWEGPEPG